MLSNLGVKIMDKIEIAKETMEGATITKTAPTIAGGTVSVLSVAGISLPDWICILTAVSLVVQVCFTLWKWRQEALKSRATEENDQ